MEADAGWAPLVPELSCSDLARSLHFYCRIIGFRVRFERPGFAYLELGGAQLMLEAEALGWVTAERSFPYGRGVNLQIEAPDVDVIFERVLSAGLEPFQAPRDSWYPQGDRVHGQRELLVQDPDGYLLRLAQVLGTRSAP